MELILSRNVHRKKTLDEMDTSAFIWKTPLKPSFKQMVADM